MSFSSRFTQPVNPATSPSVTVGRRMRFICMVSFLKGGAGLPNDVGAEEDRPHGRNGAPHFRIDADVARVDVGILRRRIQPNAVKTDALREALIERVTRGDVPNAPVRTIRIEARQRVQPIDGT